jgi:DNA-binding NtrC family response regulator
VRRLGGKKEIPVDIRILAATNKDLQKALADNELREDLYYRLAVVDIVLPPLRERADDIQLLANEFLARFCNQNGKRITDFEAPAWEWLLSYHWPGNVRELKNAVERAVIMARGSTITLADIMPKHLKAAGSVPTSVTIPVGASMSDARRQLVLRTFASTGGDLSRAAKLLGMSSEEIRTELLAVLDGQRSDDGGKTVSMPEPPVAAPASSPISARPPNAAAAKKIPTKKR